MKYLNLTKEIRALTMPCEPSGGEIDAAIRQCLAELEKLCVSELRQFSPDECDIIRKDGYVFIDLSEIDDFYAVHSINRVGNDGFESSIDYYIDGKLLTVPQTDGRSIYSVNYHPSLTNGFDSDRERCIVRLGDGLLPAVPLFCASLLTVSEEPSLSESYRERYELFISGILANRADSSNMRKSIYSQLEAQKTSLSGQKPGKISHGEITGSSSPDCHPISSISGLSAVLRSKADGIEIDGENNVWYLRSGSRRISPAVPFGSGGGSVPSLPQSALTMTIVGFASKTVALGAPLSLSFFWSSEADGFPTGNGSVRVTLGNTVLFSKTVSQGNVSLEVGRYLQPGVNNIVVSLTDSRGTRADKTYTIETVYLDLTSNFVCGNAIDTSLTDKVNFTYIPTGETAKTMYFILDGTDMDSGGTHETVYLSAEQQTRILTGLTHGSHSLCVYFTAEIGGETVTSPSLFFDLMIVNGSTAPIIASDFRELTPEQYVPVTIEYYVCTPMMTYSDIRLTVNGCEISALTVGREKQIWSYRPDSVGITVLSIECGSVTKTFSLDVQPSRVNIPAVSADLSLCLSCYGRSNGELPARRQVWEDTDRGIRAVLTGFNFASDGWMNDSDGNGFLRVTGSARVTIPYRIFSSDFSLTGKTIEIEFRAHKVMDYESVIISCLSGNIGLDITPSLVRFRSNLRTISTQYKEDERVRISIVVEKSNETHLVLMYLNGVMSGAVMYPVGNGKDRFSQLSPVDMTIGSDDCSVDIYSVRVYDNDLTRRQILNNYIADTRNGAKRRELFERNDIYGQSGEISAEKLPADTPYIVFATDTLPRFKGDKQTADITFTDALNPGRSFISPAAEMNVQGTSSQAYFRKNYKIKFKNGFAGSSTMPSYAMKENAIPADTFTFKADVASSEGVNNVGLVGLYNDLQPFSTPPQMLDSRVRVGIDGFPVVAFHDGIRDAAHNIRGRYFLGKMNFNNDKSSDHVFGFEEGDESWEILNNTSDRSLFRSADFSGDSWKEAFEARYPDGNTDVSRLSALCSWIASTDRSLPELSNGEKEARLLKFVSELEDHFNLGSCLFYYLFTELFLLVDSRAKNAFPTYFASRQPGDGGDRWFWLPYDMDTALGTNNEGELVFGYSLEDTDMTGNAFVFNGADSVFWNNLRDGFGDELTGMYQSLRSGESSRLLSYEAVEKRFEDHQAAWSEAIFNEDAYSKYLRPLIETGDDGYLGMLQGSKREQRKWWLYNRFRYMDSKYNAGDARSDRIEMRGYAKGDITITPFADIYPSVLFGSVVVKTRGRRNESFTLACPLDSMNDTEIHIYSASQLKYIGDLSPLHIGRFIANSASRLQAIKLGDGDPGYENTTLRGITIGNLTMLRSIDCRNCVNLEQTPDLSGCISLEYAYFAGTRITGIQLPAGGILKELELPATVTNLTVIDQPLLESVTLGGCGLITDLTIRNIPDGVIDVLSLILSMPDGSRAVWEGFSLPLLSGQDMAALKAKFGRFSDDSSLTGQINLSSVGVCLYLEYTEAFPNVGLSSEEFINDVLRDSGGKALFGSDGQIIAAADGGCDLGISAAELDELIEEWSEA